MLRAQELHPAGILGRAVKRYVTSPPNRNEHQVFEVKPVDHGFEVENVMPEAKLMR
jgi:hypothetical protein